MKRNCVGRIVLAGWLSVAAAPAWGQDADAPADDPAAEKQPAGKPAAKERALSPEAQRIAAARAEAFDRHPAVQAVLSSRPSTPVDLFRAIALLADFGFYLEAKPLMQQYLAAATTPPQHYDVVNTYGTAGVVRLSRAEGIDDDGRKFIRTILDGAARHARDQQRVDQLVEQAATGSPREQAVARFTLREAGAVGQVALLKALADPNRAEQRAALRAALAEHGRGAIGPLVAAVGAPDANLAAQAALTLGQMGEPSVAPYLLAPALAGDSSPAVSRAAQGSLVRLIGGVPSPDDAATFLRRETERYLRRQHRLPESADGAVEIWSWNGAQKTVARSLVSQDVAQSHFGARFGGDLRRLSPSSTEDRRLYLTSLLDHAKLAGGIDAPLATGRNTPFAVAGKHGPEAVEDALTFAMRIERIPAAIAACEVLAHVGSADMLVNSTVSAPFADRALHASSPLAAAAQHSDRRLRFAAVGTIMQWNPPSSYAGASHVGEALAWYVGAAGRPRVLVAEPRMAVALSIAAQLNGTDVTAEAVNTGRDVLKQLGTSPDYQFALVDVGIHYPPIEALLDSLRRDVRTARTPIGLMASPERLAWARQLAANYPRVSVLPPLLEPRDGERQTEQMRRLHGELFVPGDVRVQQARQSLDWLAAIASRSQETYDLHRHEAALLTALRQPALSTRAAPVVAQLGSQAAQRALVNLASESLRPAAIRQSAANAFATSVAKHGVQLTQAEVLAQYARYNRSRDSDAGTQKILASILDAMETREAAVRERY